MELHSAVSEREAAVINLKKEVENIYLVTHEKIIEKDSELQRLSKII